MLLTDFEEFIKAHRHCGALCWDTEDSDDGFGVHVKARCLGCEAKFLRFATAAEIASDLVRSRLLTSIN